MYNVIGDNFIMEEDENKHFEGVEIKGTDPRMRFRNSQDPIYVAYQFVENQPLKTLFKAFISDMKKRIINLFSPKNRR